LVGKILVGASSDEPSSQFSVAARDTMLTVTGVDLRSIQYRYKFAFVAQVGSPQIAEGSQGAGSPCKDQDYFQNPKTFESRKSSEGRL